MIRDTKPSREEILGFVFDRCRLSPNGRNLNVVIKITAMYDSRFSLKRLVLRYGVQQRLPGAPVGCGVRRSPHERDDVREDTSRARLRHWTDRYVASVLEAYERRCFSVAISRSRKVFPRDRKVHAGVTLLPGCAGHAVDGEGSPASRHGRHFKQFSDTARGKKKEKVFRNFTKLPTISIMLSSLYFFFFFQENYDSKAQRPILGLYK